MKRLLLIFICCLTGLFVRSQKFSGQWKGSFIDKSTSAGGFSGEKCDYVLELEASGNKVTGSSYTYFSQSGKNYYTICKVEGSIDFKRKYIEVRETERTKTNIPVTIRNCLQIHKLTYFKQGNIETLEGNWQPSPNQEPGCGFGVTNLTKRSLSNAYPGMFSGKNQPRPVQEKSVAEVAPRFNNADIRSKIRADKKNLQSDNVTGDIKNEKTDNPITEINADKSGDNKKTEPAAPSKLDTRKNQILKSIEVENQSVKVSLYDNGEIDGDSVSLFYNGKLLISNRKLTDKPISLILDMDEENAVNELTMFAENLGTIPPNTALMIVTDGPNRYEVRITSDLEKSGVIRFIHKSRK